jgi:hypothetical protein
MMEIEKQSYKAKWDLLAPARSQFLSRCYEWAQADLDREVEENLPLLRRVKGRLAASELAVAEYLSKEQRSSMFRARLKRMHGDLMEKKLSSPEEDVLAEELQSRWRAYRDNPSLRGYPEPVPSIPRQGFRKLLKEKLANQGFGEFDGWDLPTEWRYRLPLGPWTVETYIDTGGRSRQLEYGHVIKDTHDVPLLITGVRLSSLGLLGLAPAIWDMLTPEDLPEAAEDLIVLCGHLMDAFPALLDGIEPPVV